MRRLAALLLILCLVFCLLPTMSAASGISVCFIAANDNLLELSYQPYWQGSTIYVPYTVFVNFKIYNSFHQSSNTASLYSSTKQLYFNLDSGETYDGNGTYYNVTPISRGGQVYVPLDFICGQYGLNWSYINSSNSFIDVCRISDANVILSNDQFLTAAKPLMETRYNAYVSSNGGSVDWGGGGGSSSENDSVVYLSFVGLPSGTLLESLASYGVKATASSSPPPKYARARPPCAKSSDRDTTSARSAPQTPPPSTPRYPPCSTTRPTSRPCSLPLPPQNTTTSAATRLK
ncbi:MAG: stalk domain-containing protein [Lachnospiraceae bacterium]